MESTTDGERPSDRIPGKVAARIINLSHDHSVAAKLAELGALTARDALQLIEDSSQAEPVKLARAAKLFRHLTVNELKHLPQLKDIRNNPVVLKALLTADPMQLKRLIRTWTHLCLAPDSAREPGLVLLASPPDPKNPEIDDLALEYALSHTGAGPDTIQALGRQPKLSSIDNDGVLYIVSHGEPGRLVNSTNQTVSIDALINVLTDSTDGLPPNYTGKIKVLSCDAGVSGKNSTLSVVEQIAMGLRAKGRHNIQVIGGRGATVTLPLVGSKYEVVSSEQHLEKMYSITSRLNAYFLGRPMDYQSMRETEQQLATLGGNFGGYGSLRESVGRELEWQDRSESRENLLSFMLRRSIILQPLYQRIHTIYSKIGLSVRRESNNNADGLGQFEVVPFFLPQDSPERKARAFS